jgi:uncharacterized membrane protein YobD (UPF0266 family)
VALVVVVMALVVVAAAVVVVVVAIFITIHLIVFKQCSFHYFVCWFTWDSSSIICRHWTTIS